MYQFDDTVRFDIKSNCYLVIHSVPCIDQGTLILRIQMFAFLGELLGMSVYQVDEADDILTAAVDNDVRESSLALITVLDPAAVIDRELIYQSDSFLLRSDRSDPADLGLVIERHVNVLGPCYKEGLKNIVFLRFLFEKTDVFYVVYLAYAAAGINNIVANLKAQTNLPFLDFLKNIYKIMKKLFVKINLWYILTVFILSRIIQELGGHFLQKSLYFGDFV